MARKKVDPFAKYADMVIYNLPDGTPISNDRRFDVEEYQEYLANESDEDITEVDSEEGVDYESMTAKEIKALAKEREIDTSGMTKKSEVIAALVAADTASDESDEDDESDEEETQPGNFSENEG